MIALNIAVCHCCAFSQNYVVAEDKISFSVGTTETFNDVMMNISKHLEGEVYDGQKSIQLQVLPEGYKMVMQLAKKPRAIPRSYAAGVAASEAADISYIVKTLANSSLPKIKSAESALKKAGDRIDPIHPLQFLGYVFTTEELKVAIRNLQGRSWVWSDFISGLTDTLAEENGKNNIQPYLQDFANKINVNVNIIAPLQQAGKWDKFVTTLIDIVPRADGSGRYDQ